jgi:hypothetical protein
MTFLEMQASLRSRIGNPLTSEVPNTTLQSVINRAYRDVGTKYPFNETRCITTFNTIVDSPRYDIPTDADLIYRVWDDTNKCKIRKRGVRYMTGIPLNYPTGKPLAYVRVRNWMQLIPTPDAIYSVAIYYLLTLGDLSADTDKPVLPLPWHEGLVLKARHMYYDDRGEIGKAIYALNAWKEWLSDKPQEMDIEKDDMDDIGVVISSLGNEFSSGANRDPRFNERFDYEY